MEEQTLTPDIPVEANPPLPAIDIIREPAATSRFWKLVPVDPPEDWAAPPERKSLAEQVREMFDELWSAATGRNKHTDLSGFKAYGDRWVAWWTNNFEDREGEFFTEKAIDDYIRRVDLGIVPYPELWYWHIPGTKHGQADWLGRIGHYAVAAGTFDDTDLGRAAKAWYAAHPKGDAMSHGFVYDPARKRDGVYHQFNTFEITNGLTAKTAANPFTDFEGVKIMPLSDDKRKGLEERFGADLAARILESTEDKNKALEALGIAYKDFAAPDADLIETDADVPAEVETDLKELVTDLSQGQALTANAALKALEEVKSLKERIAAQDAVIAELKAAFDDRPQSASKAAATVIEQTDLPDTLKDQLKTTHPFWGTTVEENV